MQDVSSLFGLHALDRSPVEFEVVFAADGSQPAHRSVEMPHQPRGGSAFGARNRTDRPDASGCKIILVGVPMQRLPFSWIRGSDDEPAVLTTDTGQRTVARRC